MFHQRADRRDRFTPTGVGTIVASIFAARTVSVHPHGRGDNFEFFHGHFLADGSPPRAWGQSLCRALKPLMQRFTPTGVGTITQCHTCNAESAVHPHGRGDNGAVNGAPNGASGSPPRAWGQCGGMRTVRICMRFTPTGVGTICHCHVVRFCLAVHPHGRGDNERSDVFGDATFGSPPRAWGQSPHLFPDRQHQRFTPTGVGTMLPLATLVTGTTVHPHGRGDNDSALLARLVGRGSPPRAWGQSCF